MIYIKFKNRNRKERFNKTENVFKKLLKFFMKPITANPDFDGKMNSVIVWLIEYNEQKKIIEREIGLDEENNVIMKMPFRNNYGYWLDTNLEIKDYYELFKGKEINQSEFVKKWNDLI